MADDGIVNIHGKSYKTVALRIQEFREQYEGHCIETEVLNASDPVQVKAIIRDPGGAVIATGLAEEVRGSTNINKTSALENAETSAVGRALAFLGLGGTEIASAGEVANAISQQKEFDMVERLKRHNDAVREHIDSIVYIKNALLHDDYSTAYEAYAELPKPDWEALWVAPTRGGIWTTEERGKFKSDDWNNARKVHHNITDEDAA